MSDPTTVEHPIYGDRQLKGELLPYVREPSTEAEETPADGEEGWGFSSKVQVEGVGDESPKPPEEVHIPGLKTWGNRITVFAPFWIYIAVYQSRGNFFAGISVTLKGQMGAFLPYYQTKDEETRRIERRLVFGIFPQGPHALISHRKEGDRWETWWEIPKQFHALSSKDAWALDPEAIEALEAEIEQWDPRRKPYPPGAKAIRLIGREEREQGERVGEIDITHLLKKREDASYLDRRIWGPTLSGYFPPQVVFRTAQGKGESLGEEGKIYVSPRLPLNARIELFEEQHEITSDHFNGVPLFFSRGVWGAGRIQNGPSGEEDSRLYFVPWREEGDETLVKLGSEDSNIQASIRGGVIRIGSRSDRHENHRSDS